MTNFADARHSMIEGQIKPNQVNDPRVLAALRETARELFVPAALRGVAYVDEDIEIAPGRALIQPCVFARMLQAAAIQSTDNVLDVAAGSGYSSAVISALGGTVVALEENAELAAQATALLAESGRANVTVVQGALNKGVAGQAPYNVIVVNGCVEDVPPSLLDQLADEGRLVAVEIIRGVGKAVIYEKHGGVVGCRDLFEASVAELPGFAKPKGFVF